MSGPRVKESSREPSTLLEEFVAHQNENVFMRAFAFATDQLPLATSERLDLAERFVLLDEIGFVFQIKERDAKVALKAGELEKWVTNQVVRKGAKEIQNTVELMRSYAGLSLVNDFGHRVSVAPRKAHDLVCAIVYRVPPKPGSFRAARFKVNRNGGFIHILRDADYFEICEHFITPSELHDYFGFRRDVLINWDPPATAVTESALIGQYLLEDYVSPPDPKFERAAMSHGGPIACEFAFVMDNLGGDIASQSDDYADTDGYQILAEIGSIGRRELRALRQELRLTLEAVRADRFELPYRVTSNPRNVAFLMVPVTRQFRERAFDALVSLSLASKHELQVDKQIGIGMWRTREFVDIEWVFIESANHPNPALDARLQRMYPFRRSSEKRLPPIFL